MSWGLQTRDKLLGGAGLEWSPEAEDGDGDASLFIIRSAFVSLRRAYKSPETSFFVDDGVVWWICCFYGTPGEIS